MIRINLFPEHRRKQIKERSDVLNQLAIGVGVIVVFVGLCGAVSYLKKQELAGLHETKAQQEQRLAALKKQVAVVEDLQKKKKAVEAKKNAIVELRTNQEGPVLIMDFVSRSLDPLQVWLMSLDIDGTNVQMTGRAVTNEDIVEFQTNLQKTPPFSTVNLVESRQQAEKDVPVYEFKLRLDVVNDRPGKKA